MTDRAAIANAPASSLSPRSVASAQISSYRNQLFLVCIHSSGWISTPESPRGAVSALSSLSSLSIVAKKCTRQMSSRSRIPRTAMVISS